MMICFTALRLNVLQLPVCLKSLRWIDGFTLLVFILNAERNCDLIYFVHADQWSVLVFRQKLPSIVCSAVWTGALQRMGRGLKCLGWGQTFKLISLWNMNGPLKPKNGKERKIWPHSVSERLVVFSKEVKRIQKPGLTMSSDWLDLGVSSWLSLAFLCLRCVKNIDYSLPASYFQQI